MTGMISQMSIQTNAGLLTDLYYYLPSFLGIDTQWARPWAKCVRSRVRTTANVMEMN